MLAVSGALVLGIALVVHAVGGAAFTTFNAHVDGAGKDVCKNTATNCNIYGAKEYVWLNGGPDANHLKPDGLYFFAVLEPGGQPDPNDQGGGEGGVPDKNLSDDYDAYTNRTFRTEGGEVVEYLGDHWLDDGKSGPKPNDKPPYIRLFPYSDTTNPGGVYILAICSLDDGYPVDPRDCKYDAFKVKKGRLPYSFMLSGIKFQDTYADGVKDDTATDPGLSGWDICIFGTGPDGNPFDNDTENQDCDTTTGEGGYWEWLSPEYVFNGGDKPQEVQVTICEVLQPPDWTQSYPDPAEDACYHLVFTPTAGTFDSFEELDFGNWQPGEVTGCKYRDTDGDPDTTEDQVPVPGWNLTLVCENDVQEVQINEVQAAGDDGCYTWPNVNPGWTCTVSEEEVAGWQAVPDPTVTANEFPTIESGGVYSHTFVNEVQEGCTPGFWQGGNGFGTAGGKWLWNEDDDQDWEDSGGNGTNPYKWVDSFCAFFGCAGNNESMWHFVNPETWEVNDDFHKAARSLTAAYLNASWGMSYPYTTSELHDLWDAAYPAALATLHTELDAANNAYYRDEPPPHCPISASGF